MMRNELAFIPDNISAISYASMQMQPTIQHDLPEFQTDSTENLAEEIFKYKQGKEESRVDLGSLDEAHKKMLFDIKDSGEILTPSEFRMKEGNKTFHEKQSQNVIPQLNESMAERQDGEEVVTPVSQSRNSFQAEKEEKVESRIPFVDRLETLNNQTNQEIQSEEKSNVSKKQGGAFEYYEEEHKDVNRNKIEAQEKVNESVEHQHSFTERLPKLNISQSPSERRQSSHSQYSMQMHNFIEEQASQENSDPQSHSSGHSRRKIQKQSSYQHHSVTHNNTMANKIQALSRLDAKSGLEIDTPVNLFHRTGTYEFTPQQFPSEEQELVEAITKKLNRIEKGPSFYDEPMKVNPKQQKKPQPPKHIEEVKIIDPTQQELETDFSDLSRDAKIMQHRYESNIAVLSDQTKQLLEIYEEMIRNEEIKQLKKEIMMLQIHNHRAKISLRTASYTKRFNFISPIPKNNDKPLQFRSKFAVKKVLVDQLEDLQRKIKEEQAVFQEQEARLTLLTKYYNIAKGKKIPNNQENAIQFEYNSKLGRYTNPAVTPVPADSMISIEIPFTTTSNQFNIAKSTKSPNLKQTNAKKGMTSPRKKSPKKTQVTITEPYQKYNLLKYKTEISKEMMVEYEVYNLGRLKRIRDENRMMKKELEFVDQHIEHFDRSFAQQLKRYEQLAKPKITYESFKIIDQQTPYTKSPMSRDYYGNCKGSNNINIYRPDSFRPSPYKSTAKINQSLSQSKYTIKRDLPFNQSSKKELTLSQDYLLTQNNEKSETVVSFFRQNASPHKSQKNQYCFKTSKRKLNIKSPQQKPDASSNRKTLVRSEHSSSPVKKHLLRFNTQADINTTRNSAKSPILRTGKITKPTISRKQVQSEYYLSADGTGSIK